MMQLEEVQRLTRSLNLGVPVNHAKLAKSVLSEAEKRANGDAFMAEDLVSQGLLGIVKAQEKYDPSKGSFLTFARYWLKVSIRDYHRAQCRAVDVFRGRQGREVYKGGEKSEEHKRALSFDLDASREDETVSLYNVVEGHIPDPESLLLAKERALAARSLVAQARNEREAAAYAVLQGEVSNMAAAGRQVGVSKQAMHKMSQRLLLRARRKVKGLELS
jgi:RNA polymerase sigma factor (sigma-70 family)